MGRLNLRSVRGNARGSHPAVVTLIALFILLALLVALLLAISVLTTPPMWVTSTVTVQNSATSTTPMCSWVNSSAWNDRFCLWAASAPVLGANVTAWTLGGTYDHGPTTPKVPFLLEVSTNPGFPPPAGTVTWGSPGLHGQLVYSGGYSVQISAHT